MINLVPSQLRISWVLTGWEADWSQGLVATELLP